MESFELGLGCVRQLFLEWRLRKVARKESEGSTGGGIQEGRERREGRKGGEGGRMPSRIEGCVSKFSFPFRSDLLRS